MEIYESQFVKRKFDSLTGIMTSSWLPETEKMDKEAYKKEMLSLCDLLEKFESGLLLSNTKNLRFTITPELQEWTTQEIAPRLTENQLKKQAVVIPEEIFSQVSMEQVISDVEEKEHQHQTRFFPDAGKAKEWLLE